MGFSSLHVYMDSSDWVQSTIHDDSGLDSSSPSGEMLACSRPLIERKLRPPHDQALKCPRCDSTHTKFCYYNNYSLSQPRYFCKTCRRYWTKGGTLRNIPVGGGCRKNKKVSAKKSNDQSATSNSVHPGPSYHHNHSDPQLCLPAEVQLSHLSHLLGTNAALGDSSFIDSKYSIAMLENPRPTDFMDSKYAGIIGYSSNYDFMGNSIEHFGLVGRLGGVDGHNGLEQSCNTLCSPSFGMDNNGGTYMMDSCQRMMPPYDANEDQNASMEVKPNPRLLSLEWQDHGKDSFGYLDGLGSWNGYGSSSTNPLV